MLGQNHHFRQYAPQPLPYAIERYTNEARRLYGVIDKQLTQHAYWLALEYTIADMATFPWLRNWKNQGIELGDYPALKRWFELIAQRPAVQQRPAGAGRPAPPHYRRQRARYLIWPVAISMLTRV